VTSFHVPEFPARANTSQNAGPADIGTTAQLSAAVAIEVAIESVPDAAPPAPDASPGADEDDEDPHAATAPAATSATRGEKILDS
jgi:hypothetical protein